MAGNAWRVDGGAWTEDSTVVVPAPADHGNDGRHAVDYHSWDRLGNQEPLRSFATSVDTRGPRCMAYGGVVQRRVAGRVSCIA